MSTSAGGPTIIITDPSSFEPREVRRWDPGRHDDFTVVAVRFPRPLDDDEADIAAGLFGYSWAKNGAAAVTGDVASRPIVWPDYTTMVVSAPMDFRRPERTRTRAQATSDLFTDFLTYISNGTPVRKRAGGRLVEALPNVDPTTVEVFIA